MGIVKFLLQVISVSKTLPTMEILIKYSLMCMFMVLVVHSCEVLDQIGVLEEILFENECDYAFESEVVNAEDCKKIGITVANCISDDIDAPVTECLEIAGHDYSESNLHDCTCDALYDALKRLKETAPDLCTDGRIGAGRSNNGESLEPGAPNTGASNGVPSEFASEFVRRKVLTDWNIWTFTLANMIESWKRAR